MEKQIQILLICLTISFFWFEGCAHPPPYDLEPHLGLYKVVGTRCEAPHDVFNPCPRIRFIELVKGKFYGIGPTRVAFVLWRQCGEADDYDLCYEADEIRDHTGLTRKGDRIFLRENHQDPPLRSREKQYFTLEGNRLTTYRFIYTFTNNAGKIIHRDFQYYLAPATRKDAGPHRMAYPPEG